MMLGKKLRRDERKVGWSCIFKSEVRFAKTHLRYMES